MSIINFKELRWNNAFSYGEANSLRLDESVLTQLIGENGAGKSSIPLILQEGTFNKNSKGFAKAAIPNRMIGKGYDITTLFDYKDDEYEVHLNKKSTLKVTLLKNGEDISANTGTKTLAILEEILGMSFKTFVQLVYQSTGSSLEFLTSTDSKRKEFLINLFDLSGYLERQKKFSDALKEVANEVKFLEGKMSNINSSLSRSMSDSTIEVQGEVIVPEVPDEWLEEKAKLQASKSSIAEENDKIAKSNSILDKIEKLRPEEEIEAEISDIDIPDDSPLLEELGRRNSEISAAKNVIKKIEGLTGKCPTCLQHVDEEFTSSLLETNNTVVEENRSAATELAETLTDIKKKKTSKSMLESELANVKATKAKKIFDEKKEVESVATLQEKIDEVDESIVKLKADIAKATAHNRTVIGNKAKKEAAEQQIQDLKQELAEVEGRLDSARSKLGPLETLKKAFSANGLVAYKLENKVLDLEDATNKYLTRLSGSRFNLAFNLDKDKLNVVIYDQGHAITISEVSTGELARIVISTLLGIRKVMQSLANRTINILFLDEVISVLDDQGKEQLVEVLLEEENLNTFLVSHGWQHPLVSRKLVTKDAEGISKVEDG